MNNNLHYEILHEFKQLSIQQQIETLKAALEIIEEKFNNTQKQDDSLSLLKERDESDPLLAYAGKFEANQTDIGSNHDQYIGENLSNNE